MSVHSLIPRAACLRWIIAGIAVLMIDSTFATAAPATRPSTQPVAIPYRLTDTNHILVRVKINGQGPFNFIMDTGAPTMYVRVPVAKKIGLKPNGRGTATLDMLEIEGGAKLTRVKCQVETPYQIEGMNAIGIGGVELDGLLGYSVLARFRLQIDLSKDRMLWTPLDFIPPPLVSGRRPATEPAEQVDKKEEQLESTGGLLKLLGPLVKPVIEPSKYRGLLGIELAEEKQQVTVLRVLGNSPADKAGIDWGDQLLSVNGKTVKSIAETQTAMSQIQSGKAVWVVIQRRDARAKLKITSGEGL